MRKDKVREANIEASEQRRLTASLVKGLIAAKGQDHGISKAVESWIAELYRWLRPLGIPRTRGLPAFTVRGATLMAEAHLDEQEVIEALVSIRAHSTLHGLNIEEAPSATPAATSIEIWRST